ncbi:Tetratricopeptide repeat protein [Phycisphaerae bacterium RAS1]|nr:Tetratricopeptide repeat protein [Phycisphaerae bacterium RAS1]
MNYDDLGVDLVKSVASYREAPGQSELLSAIQRHWPAERVFGLLESSSGEVVRSAATCLGLNGNMKHCAGLAELLHHPDPVIAASAEESLWRIWMRAGTPDGNQDLAAAVGAIQREQYDEAIELLSELILIEPGFAEAHHQLGLSQCVLMRLHDSLTAYREALRLNPFHFSAAAGMGHCYIELSDFRRALHAYKRALKIYPRLEGIPGAVATLERKLRATG